MLARERGRAAIVGEHHPRARVGLGLRHEAGEQLGRRALTPGVQRLLELRVEHDAIALPPELLEELIARGPTKLVAHGRRSIPGPRRRCNATRHALPRRRQA
jgi:hypothetical protein